MTYTTELNAAWMAHRDRWMSFADQGKIRYPNLYAELKAIYWSESALAQEMNMTPELVHEIFWGDVDEENDFTVEEANIIRNRFDIHHYGTYSMDYLFFQPFKCLCAGRPEDQEKIEMLRNLYKEVKKAAEPLGHQLIRFNYLERAANLLKLLDDPGGRITYAEFRSAGSSLRALQYEITCESRPAPRGLVRRVRVRL